MFANFYCFTLRTLRYPGRYILFGMLLWRIVHPAQKRYGKHILEDIGYENQQEVVYVALKENVDLFIYYAFNNLKCEEFYKLKGT